MKFLYAVLILLLTSCHKDDHPKPNPSNPGKLKTITEKDLPSPWYSLGYNAAGKLSTINFSNGIAQYDISYEGTKILEAKNTTTTNNDRIRYTYENDELVVINIIDKNGVTYRRAWPTYTPLGQLESLTWEKKEGGVGFAQEIEYRLAYYTDGNLRSRTMNIAASGTHPAAMYMDVYEEYDDNVNVDAFSLLHTDQNAHLVLTPGIDMQLNNAKRITRSGTGTNYVIKYTYTYNSAKKPVTKTGDMVFTSGPNTGKHFETRTDYDYYQ